MDLERELESQIRDLVNEMQERGLIVLSLFDNASVMRRLSVS